jgi:subtilisin family serine protease
MPRYLFLLIFIYIVVIQSFAIGSYYAIAPCPDETQQSIISECGLNNIKIVTTNAEGFVIVEPNTVDQLNQFCFYSEVRQIGRHLSFNTNVLLVKMVVRSSDLVDNYDLRSHEIIPYLYYAYPNVKNDAALYLHKEKLEKEPGIDLVGLNQVFTLEAPVNDPLYDRQWAIENNGTAIQYSGIPGADMSVDSAWTITTGSTNIKIAVLDSGVDTLHEDLVTNMLTGFDSFATDSTNTYGFPTPNYPSDGHGTCCAGIIAAEADNNLGIAGVSYSSKIIPVRIFYYIDYGAGIGVQATTSTDALLSGTAYAWRTADADIISTSAGLSSLSVTALQIDTQLIDDELNEAFYNARNGKGIAMFCSSGNDDLNDILWPAKLSNTIAVGASSMCDERKNPSDCSGENWGGNFGESLDIIAPGVKISTTDMTGNSGYSSSNYSYTFNGTSASCPNAAGVGALILSVNSGLHAADVRAILNITADRVPNYIYDSISPYGTWNDQAGHGRVNAYAAVQLAQTYQSTASSDGKTSDLAIEVFPNPTDGHISINFGAAFSHWEVKITDVQGKTILQKSLSTSGTSHFNFNGTSGIYIVSVQNRDHHKLIRLVKK